ncbi:hypothetical protein J2X65_002193 [Ancylobacter sp. 3268]|nr:hypothetical protein [Ancylobacter sp. 3268]
MRAAGFRFALPGPCDVPERVDRRTDGCPYLGKPLSHRRHKRAGTG